MKRYLKITLIILINTIIFIILLELGLRFYYSFDKKVENRFLKVIKHRKNPNLINKMASLLGDITTAEEVEHVYLYRQRPIYRVTYKFGRFGQRLHKKPKVSLKKEQHFILAGGSNAMGEGVPHGKDLTSHLALNFPSLEFHNFAHRGWGINHALGLFNHFPIEEWVSQKKGILLYQFYDFHILRYSGHQNTIKWNRGNAPEYKIDKKTKRWAYQGKFNRRLDILLTYKILNSSIYRMIQSLKKRAPYPKFSHKKLKEAASILKELKSIYEKRFPQGKFIVLTSSDKGIFSNRDFLIKELNSLGIQTIVQKVPNPYPEHYRIPHDGHLNELGAKCLGIFLSKRLSQRFSIPIKKSGTTPSSCF